MVRNEPSVEPSRLAIWLVALCGPGEAGQAALGDLLEEYLYQQQKLGTSAAKRWFWRQSLKTIAYLVGKEIRGAPLTIAAAIVGGFLLRWRVSRSLNPAVTTVVDALLHRYDVYARDPHAYLYWTVHIMNADRLVVNLLTGLILATVVKHRELATTLGLALLGDLLAIQGMSRAWARTGNTGYLWTLPWSFAFSFALIFGGVIVRARRMRRKT
jgi:hypothetical protein